LATGLFNQVPYLNCNTPPATVGSVTFAMPTASGNPNYVSTADGYDLATQVCFQPLGPSAANPEGAAKAIADLQNQYIAATAAVGTAGQNPNFIGNTLSYIFGQAYAPNFRTSRSYQMNIGVQRQIGKGVLTVDYVRNLSLHFQMAIDINHVGDANHLNFTAAQNAIAATLAACQKSTIDEAIKHCPGLHPAGGGQPAGPATIDDFASFGLDSGAVFYNNYCGGDDAAYCGITPDVGAAFGGINPALGSFYMNFPMGRSLYQGLQSEYKVRTKDPMPGLSALDLDINYTLSRFNSDGGNDQHFTSLAWDMRNPVAFMGPTSQDRTHQFKFGGTFEFAHHGPRLALIGGVYSAAPSNMQLPTQGSVGEIFRSDLTGDGTTGDFLNAAKTGIGHPGSYMRSVPNSELYSYTQNWNATYGNGSTLTPAGQALVNAKLFTQLQLVELGAVIPSIQLPPTGHMGNGIYKDVDTVVSWPFKLRERLTILPSISFFNVFNFSNFGALGGLTGGDGAINGTVAGSNTSSNTVRIGRGTGVFAVGAPREAEFGLRIDF